ncbi:PH domain-containing protein [Streptomyces sp. NPDC079020]|uniref:PH domain-containing protein n=1 Tax=Streptomyces sp. NPDC079020 TaxID=3365722 RepID=UPI0037D6470F
MTSPTPPAEPTYAARTFRSGAGLVCGVLLLLLAAWLAGDAMFRGEGQVPWLALAALLMVAPLIVAFTLRPAVFATGRDIRIRNPFRTIALPWSEVADVRAGYSTELFTQGGTKYQLWAVPVSLRERKRAARRASRQAHDDPYGRTSVNADVRDTQARVAAADRAVLDLRELAERAAAVRGTEATASGTGEAAGAATAVTAPSVRWAVELIAPAVAGAVLLVVLLAVG